MQIVIDIPQELYEDIKKCGLCGYCSDREIVSKAIANGTVLPKHGRLIDADDINNIVRPIQAEDEGWAVTGETAIQLIHDAFNKAPTVLEATKGELKCK